MSKLSALKRFARVHASAALAPCALVLVVAAGCGPAPLSHAAESAAIDTLELGDLYASPSPFGTPPSPPRWSPDSAQLAFRWNAEGGAPRDLWLASSAGEPQRLTFIKEGLPGPREFLWHHDAQHILSLRGDALWSTDVSSGAEQPVAKLGAGASALSLSPDGTTVAYLKGGDLWTCQLASGTQRQLTTLALPPLSTLPGDQPSGRYSRPEREIGPGIWGGPTYSWSPDGKTLAVHYVDRSAMRRVPFPNYLGAETSANEIRRGYPGDANEARRVGLLNVNTGQLRLLDLPDPAANQVVGFDWSSSGRLLIDLASDTAEDRWLLVASVDGGALRELWHSHRESRIYTSFASAWHPDGEQVVFLSDLEDRYALFALNADGSDAAPRRLTDPRYDVLSGPTIVSGADTVFYAANAPGPAERQVFALTLAAQDADAATPQRVTTLSGDNRGFPSPDGKQLAYLHSNDSAPPALYLQRVGSQDPRQLTSAVQPALADRVWPVSRYVSFPSAIDDYRLHARILEPAVLEPGRRYPVLFGPMYSNTVRNRWAGVYSRIQQLLVDKGYIVVQVDMRGSTGYGREFREEFLVDFAGEDIEDIESAVAYLRTVPYVDSERMGIWGSSYGGTLSVYTLLKKPGLFRAGVAAAAAVEPRFFGTDDVAIVRRPDTHPEVFENIAARYAANLEDHLLLIHGMQDHVVPFKTTAALAEALIREGKDFDFAFAPGATHAWSREAYYSRYLFGKMLAHFDRYLKPAPPEGP